MALSYAENRQEDLREYHASLDLPATDEHPDPPTLASFLYAYSLVSSRGFIIDAYHSIGLIPFCDMFNHSSISPHTSLSNDAGVCETCGSLLRCPHDTDDSERLQHLSESYLDQLEKEGMADKVDMRVQRSVKSGEEVMSCYDEEKSNAALLVEYGFIDDERNTRITWSYRDVLTPGTLPTFINLLQHLEPSSSNDESEVKSIGLIGSISETQPEPLQIRSTGEISQNLFLALYLPHTPTTDLEEVHDEVMEVMSQIRYLPYGEGSKLTPTTQSAINSLIELLERRLGGLHRFESTVTELEAQLKVSLTTDSTGVIN